jgi:hypothetical protein
MTPKDDAIIALLEPILGRVERLVRRPHDYASSFRLEAIDVTVDRSTLHLLLKDTSLAALSPAGRATKPLDLVDPRREITAYRSFLANRALGTATCFAAVDDDKLGCHWLILEWVAGRELYQIGDFGPWRAAAQWLTRLHAGGPANGCPVIEYNAAYYRRWPGRDVITSATFEALIDRLLSLPMTAIHGEFYAANVLVADNPPGLRICPVDWETLGHGPAFMDLAALTAGRWSDGQRRELVAAYRDELDAIGARPPALPDLLTQVDWCALHLALRWLSGPSDERPPHQEFDWLAEARRLVARLGASV